MKKKKTVMAVVTDNVPIQLDSKYFFERALKSLDKQRYDKALKYFKKAVDYEPENPINHCNVAGVLSEMGNYTQANDVLKKVIEDIDPKMTEVYFYMATNFAHMEQYEQAENTLIQYLEEDEEGQFLDEAEEMIEFLHSELLEPKKITKVRAKAGFYEHSHARELLEQGQFAEAIGMLEKIVEEQPDFLAAVNNLALAYYYVGFKEDAKHHMLQVLDRDSSNLHALCNLAIYYYYESDKEKLNELLSILIKVEPFYQEHLYKLATTLGIMKEHRGALKHFERLIALGEGNKDGSIYHYAAIASINIKAYDKALRYWQLAYQQGHYEPSLFYMKLAEQLKQTKLNWAFTYSYVSSAEEQLAIWKSLLEDTRTQQYVNVARAYFYYAIEYGTSEQKLISFDLVVNDAEEYYQQLVNYITYQLEDKKVKRRAIDLLLGVYKQKMEQTLNTVQRDDSPMDSQWYHVCEQLMLSSYLSKDEQDKQAALECAFFYIATCKTGAKITVKTDILVASFIYLTLRQLGKKLPFATIANHYRIHASTLSQRVKQIEEQLLAVKHSHDEQ